MFQETFHFLTEGHFFATKSQQKVCNIIKSNNSHGWDFEMVQFEGMFVPEVNHFEFIKFCFIVIQG